MKFSISLEGIVEVAETPLFVLKVIGEPSKIEKFMLAKPVELMYDVLVEEKGMRMVERGENQLLYVSYRKRELWCENEADSVEYCASDLIKQLYNWVCDYLENQEKKETEK